MDRGTKKKATATGDTTPIHRWMICFLEYVLFKKYDRLDKKLYMNNFGKEIECKLVARKTFPTFGFGRPLTMHIINSIDKE